jgi:hypothetical protein
VQTKIYEQTGKYFVRLTPSIAGIFIFVYWLMPRDWEVYSELEGSWKYALGKMPHLGMSLGKDAWFTYGPIAHWFAPPMAGDNFQPIAFYLIGLFVAALFYMSLRRILAEPGPGLLLKSAACALILYSFTAILSRHESYLIIATLLTFTTGYYFDRTRLWWIYCLMALSVIGILFKIPFGMLALFSLCIALVHARVMNIVTGGWAIRMLSLCVVTTYGVFIATAGSFDIFTYFRLGMEVSGMYSEIMVAHRPFTPLLYPYAILFAAAIILTGFAAGRDLPRFTRAAFILTLLAVLFYLFKHGHVRAGGGHTKLYYNNLAPLFVIVGMAALSRLSSPVIMQKKRIVVIIAMIIATIIIFSWEKLPEKYRPFIQETRVLAEYAVVTVRGENTGTISAKVDYLKARHAPLFSYLSSRCRDIVSSGLKPTITFYPWQLMHAEAVDGCTLRPSPGLQNYTSGPHTMIQRLEAEFLDSENRPAIIVVGEQALDKRNSVTEYTDILPVLYRNYEIAASINNYVVLVRSKSPIKDQDSIVCKEAGDGESAFLFRIRQEPLSGYNNFIWHVAKFLFKAPEMTVSLSGTDQRGQAETYSFRAFHSQLSKGVYLSHDDIVAVILRGFRWSKEHSTSLYKDKAREIQKSSDLHNVSALAKRKEGMHNLPVVPEEQVLKIQYCNFNRNQ